ncbi:hypothetical protein M3Y99_00306700 [Aphelenchoides fujianensis]|nr:hypothetical protein M3Y99_00306700 [Aphelenchoides fujianensis]
MHSLNSLLNILDFEVQTLFRFIDKIPEINDIEAQDLRLLTWRNFFPFFAIKHVYRMCEMKSLSIADGFFFDDGTVASLSNMPPELAQLFVAISSCVDEFRSSVDWDPASISSLLVLQFLAVGPDEELSLFVNQATIDRLRSTIVNALKDHCCNATAQQNSKLANIVRQIDKFLPFRALGLNCLQKVQNAGCILPQSLGEIFRESHRLVLHSVGHDSSLNFAGFNADPTDILKAQQAQHIQQQQPGSSRTDIEHPNIKVEFQVPF